MSEINTKVDVINENNELLMNSVRCEEAILENLWIIGVSKTHPGLKYYFNTVTGVSLWNISKEDMERAKQTMKVNGNQSQYINCPEPKDPPPSKKNSTHLSAQSCCEHIIRHPKSCNKPLVNSGLGRETSGFTCDVCYTTINSPPNVITVNFRPYTHPTCVSPLDNACTTMPQNQIQSPNASLNTFSLENNYSSNCANHMLGSKKFDNKSITDMMIQDISNEDLNNLNNTADKSCNHSTSQYEILDLAPLKMFAKNGVIKDKWYIIADADVYLHHINFLKSVVNSDEKCCLMIPQNVKIELEKATKTSLRTNAHCACYFIYNMFDYGLANIDENVFKHIQDRSNEEHILECCSKLKEDNLYVVVISDDIELQKYRNKTYIPIFTVAELKEYLYKSNSFVTTKSFVPKFNVPQSNKDGKLSATNNTFSFSNKLSDLNNLANPSAIVKKNQNFQTKLMFNDNRKQIQGFTEASKVTFDAEVQTNIDSIQFEEMENVYKKVCSSDQYDSINNRKEIPISQSHKSSQQSNVRDSGKRIRLRRKRTFEQTEPKLSPNLVNSSDKNLDVNNAKNVSHSNDNLSLNKNVEELNKEISTSNINLKQNETVKSKKSRISLSDHCHNMSKNEIEIKNVMFEVKTKMMEQSLSSKCDEWVSRFVQIMEEVFTQILRKNSSSYLPPPLNMYEAAVCVEKMFSNDEDLADASEKFLNVLSRVCDEKGNINANISPTQYMEMYSFGVYMVDALQGIFSTCEDLQVAAESLSKLLNDIQDPESDAPNLEPFHCSSQEEQFDDTDKVQVFMIVETESLSNENSIEDTECLPTTAETVTTENNRSNNNTEGLKNGSQFTTTVPNTDFPNNCLSNEYFSSNNHNNHLKAVNIKCNEKSQEDSKVIDTETTAACNPISVTSPSMYNLRSRWTTMSSEKQDNQTLLNKNETVKNNSVKSTFLSHLFLRKSEVGEKPHNPEDNFDNYVTTEVTSDDINLCRNEKTYQLQSHDSGLSHKMSTVSNEPNVIRNFVVCSEFEDRLKTRRVHDELEDLYFEGEFMETDYIDEEESTGDMERLLINEYPEYHDNVDGNPHMEDGTTNSIGYNKIDFKYFIRRIAQEIKELSSEVYTFSQKSCEALNSLSTSDAKNGIRERAEQVHLCINKLCTALTTIHDRDKNGGCNVQALLKCTEFDDISVDEDQVEAYVAFIARCLEQANDLKSTIKDVLSAVC